MVPGNSAARPEGRDSGIRTGGRASKGALRRILRVSPQPAAARLLPGHHTHGRRGRTAAPPRKGSRGHLWWNSKREVSRDER